MRMEEWRLHLDPELGAAVDVAHGQAAAMS